MICLTLIDIAIVIIQALLAGAMGTIYIIRARTLPRCERSEFVYAGLTLALIFLIIYRLIVSN